MVSQPLVKSIRDAASPLLPTLAIAPAQVMRGREALTASGGAIARLGHQLLVVGGDRSLAVAQPVLDPILTAHGLTATWSPHGQECSETTLATLNVLARNSGADLIVGIGGGKALDAAKLLAHCLGLPVITIPTSAATCAAWTALANVYSDQGAFLYDVPLPHCPDLLILDYGLVATAPPRLLVAGIGDALAKWYEASISSGDSSQTLTIAAVQQARVLRDILLQKAASALKQPTTAAWCEVVDATVLMAGVMGGLGGAQCRTVAAHAVHNGLTHCSDSHHTLHGEKVAYGILVQLRLQEMIQGHQLAATARQQLLKFYGEIGLPQTLEELGLGALALNALDRAAALACAENSDIHRLPFPVEPCQLLAAMVSTTAPCPWDPKVSPSSLPGTAKVIDSGEQPVLVQS